MEMQGINKMIGVNHKTIFCWLLEVADRLPESRAETQAYYIEVNE